MLRPLRACVVTLIALGVLACGDTDVKVVSTSRLTATHDVAGPYVVRTRVLGDAGDVVLHHSFTRGQSFLQLEMTHEGDGVYAAAIPGAGRPGVQVQYFVTAGDDARDPDAREVFAFEVLPEEGPCAVDGDCVTGEICVGSQGGGSCRMAGVACGPADECAQGFSCDGERGQCVVIRRSCTLASGDTPCLTSEVCDAGVGFCVPRLACEAGMCPSGFRCDTARALCLRQ